MSYPKTFSTTILDIYTSLEYIATRLLLSNSFWNCIIYSVRNRQFRKAIVHMFVCEKDEGRKQKLVKTSNAKPQKYKRTKCCLIKR